MAKVRLGDIATVVTKGTTPTTMGFQFEDGGINFVKIESISEDGTFLKEKFSHISDECNVQMRRSQLQENDILFSIAGAIGRSAIVTKEILPANTNQALAIIRVSKGKIDYNYLLYALSSSAINQQATQHQQGVAQLNISLKNVSDFLLPIYTEAMQKRIVHNLKKIDKLISLRKQQLAKLDELVKARFVEMFGDCKTNPKNWKTKALERIANVGSSKRVFVEELQDSGIPFYRGTEIGALAEKKAVIPALFITEEHYKQLCETTGKPQKGDLLMPSICPDGRIWIVDTDEPFYFKDGRVLWVHLTSANYNSVFLLYTLKDRIMTDYASIASGTTFAELKIFALKKCKVFDVPLELQNQFANFVECVDQQKQTVQQSLEKLELMKKALMQEYFG